MCDVDPDLDLGLEQGPEDNGEKQKNTNGYQRLPQFAAEPGLKVQLSHNSTPMEIYKLFITDQLINSWKASQIVTIIHRTFHFMRTGSVHTPT